MTITNRVLVVDDEVKVCEMVGRYLKAKGCNTSQAHNGVEALEKCASFEPDVVLLDIKMPKMDGVEALKLIKKARPDTEVIMATATGDMETAISCMKSGAFGYQLKPLNLESVMMDIGKALEHRKLVLENRDYQANLEKRVYERTREIRQLNERLRKSFLNTIRITSGLVEVYDPFLGAHTKRVAKLAAKVAYLLKLPQHELFDLELAGLLHEVGMITIPEQVRNSPFSELKQEEIKIINNYPVFSQSILSPSEELNRAGTIIRHHLEHLDGTGFPDGLEGDDIPIGSRILGVANAYDEIAKRRRFTKEKFPSDKIKGDFVFNHLEKLSGKFYEKDLVEKLERAVRGFSKGIKSKELNSVDDLKPGMVMAMDIRTKDGRLLIAEGNSISHINIMKIQTLYKVKLLEEKIYIYENPDDF